MDFDEMKKQYKQIKAPEATLTGDIQKKQEVTMNQFLKQLKTRDNENKKFLRTFYIFYIVMVFLHTGLFLLDSSPHLTLYQRLGGLCLVVSFSFLAAYFKKEHSNLSNVNYDDSTLEFLNRTEERFNFMSKRRLSFLIPIYLGLDLGLFLIIYARFGGQDMGILELLLWFHLCFGAVIGIGVFLGIRMYKTKDAPILKQVRELKKKFSADNHSPIEA